MTLLNWGSCIRLWKRGPASRNATSGGWQVQSAFGRVVLHVRGTSPGRDNQLPRPGLVSHSSRGGAWKTKDTQQQLLFLRAGTSLTLVRWDVSRTPPLEAGGGGWALLGSRTVSDMGAHCSCSPAAGGTLSWFWHVREIVGRLRAEPTPCLARQHFPGCWDTQAGGRAGGPGRLGRVQVLWAMRQRLGPSPGTAPLRKAAPSRCRGQAGTTACMRGLRREGQAHSQLLALQPRSVAWAQHSPPQQRGRRGLGSSSEGSGPGLARNPV